MGSKEMWFDLMWYLYGYNYSCYVCVKQCKMSKVIISGTEIEWLGRWIFFSTFSASTAFFLGVVFNKMKAIHTLPQPFFFLLLAK